MRVWKEVKRARKKKEVPTDYTILSKYNNNNKHNLLVFYEMEKKYIKIQLIKKQHELEQSKYEKSSTLPDYIPLMCELSTDSLVAYTKFLGFWLH